MIPEQGQIWKNNSYSSWVIVDGVKDEPSIGSQVVYFVYTTTRIASTRELDAFLIAYTLVKNELLTLEKSFDSMRDKF